MKILFMSLIVLCIFSCQKQEDTGLKITATITKNDVFKGYALSDPESIHIERALKLLFKNGPVKAAIADSIAFAIRNNELFKGATNKIVLMFKGGIIKDSVEVSLQRDLSKFKKSSFIIQAPNTIQYTTLSNTKNGCTIKAGEMVLVSNGTSIAADSNKVYRLDTVTGNFYDADHTKLTGAKGLRSYTAPGIYKVSYIVYKGNRTEATKTIVYNTTKYNTDWQHIPDCRRAEYK